MPYSDIGLRGTIDLGTAGVIVAKMDGMRLVLSKYVLFMFLFSVFFCVCFFLSIMCCCCCFFFFFFFLVNHFFVLFFVI